MSEKYYYQLKCIEYLFAFAVIYNQAIGFAKALYYLLSVVSLTLVHPAATDETQAHTDATDETLVNPDEKYHL